MSDEAIQILQRVVRLGLLRHARNDEELCGFPAAAQAFTPGLAFVRAQPLNQLEREGRSQSGGDRREAYAIRDIPLVVACDSLAFEPGLPSFLFRQSF